MSKLEQFVGNASCLVIVALIAWAIGYTLYNMFTGSNGSTAAGGERGDTYEYAG